MKRKQSKVLCNCKVKLGVGHGGKAVVRSNFPLETIEYSEESELEAPIVVQIVKYKK